MKRLADIFNNSTPRKQQRRQATSLQSLPDALLDRVIDYMPFIDRLSLESTTRRLAEAAKHSYSRLKSTKMTELQMTRRQYRKLHGGDWTRLEIVLSRVGPQIETLELNCHRTVVINPPPVAVPTLRIDRPTFRHIEGYCGRQMKNVKIKFDVRNGMISFAKALRLESLELKFTNRDSRIGCPTVNTAVVQTINTKSLTVDGSLICRNISKNIYKELVKTIDQASLESLTLKNWPVLGDLTSLKVEQFPNLLHLSVQLRQDDKKCQDCACPHCCTGTRQARLLNEIEDLLRQIGAQPAGGANAVNNQAQQINEESGVTFPVGLQSLLLNVDIPEQIEIPNLLDLRKLILSGKDAPKAENLKRIITKSPNLEEIRYLEMMELEFLDDVSLIGSITSLQGLHTLGFKFDKLESPLDAYALFNELLDGTTLHTVRVSLGEVYDDEHTAELMRLFQSIQDASTITNLIFEMDNEARAGFATRPLYDTPHFAVAFYNLMLRKRQDLSVTFDGIAPDWWIPGLLSETSNV